MDVTSMQETALELVWAKVRSGPLSLMRSTMAAVVDEALEAGAHVDLMGPHLHIAFGIPGPVLGATLRRRALVGRLSQEHGHALAMIHGSRSWPVGQYGGGDRLHYGPWLPR